jgi:hypothetical protein
MRHTKTLAVVTAVVTCVLGFNDLANAGDVYKYVDERGVTMYTDKPFPGAVLVSSGSQRPPETAARGQAASQAAINAQLAASNQRIAGKQADSRLAATVAKDVEASQAERCKKAREVYATSVNSQHLYRETADGQRVFLTDDELTKQRLDAARAVEAICGPQG